MNIQVRKATVNNINQWRVYVDGELAAGCPSEYWANEIAENFRVRKEELELPLENTDNMKNIYLIPTDKPSRLLWCFEDKRHYTSTDEYYFKNQKELQNQHIYITSDEEIKEGDWCINTVESIVLTLDKETEKAIPFESIKKIILTTDQDLINDGVQAIDNEFLEWFVKNPSCESVEVEKGYLGMCGFVKSDEPISKDKLHYKIIIPKEEPKQETLEEFIKSQPYYGTCTTEYKEGIEEGAKWQAERMYSEEIINILDNVRYWETCPDKYKVIIEKFIEQFKKK